MRGLATVPKVDSGAFSDQRQRWKTPRALLAVHCFCVCSGSALLGISLGEVDPGNVIFCLFCRFILGFCVLSRFILLYVDECWLLWFSCQYLPPPPSVWPHMFCGAGHEKRRGEQLKWSLAFAPCGLRGCKNWPASFPGRMSYKATKPGLALSVVFFLACFIVLFIRAPFYVLLAFVLVPGPWHFFVCVHI